MSRATKPTTTKKPRGSGYNTGLAAEFYVLSCLHRLGLSATMTLGNKKAIDLAIIREKGEAATVEVKGVAGKHDWFAPNLGDAPRPNHFVVLVGFEGRIDDPSQPPRVWIFPHAEALKHVKPWSGTRGIPRKSIVGGCKAFEGAWHLIKAG